MLAVITDTKTTVLHVRQYGTEGASLKYEEIILVAPAEI